MSDRLIEERSERIERIVAAADDAAFARYRHHAAQPCSDPLHWVFVAAVIARLVGVV